MAFAQEKNHFETTQFGTPRQVDPKNAFLFFTQEKKCFLEKFIRFAKRRKNLFETNQF